MHYWWNDGWSWWNWAVMTGGMVAFWGLVAWAVVALVRSSERAPRVAARSPEQVLAQRFAAGEMDSDEYQQRLEALRAANVPDR